MGFQQLSADQYVEAIKRLRPDVVVGLADLVVGQRPGVKRRGRMVDRTHAYTLDATEQLYGGREGGGRRNSSSVLPADDDNPPRTAYFAPVLPLDNAEQSIYLDELQDEETGPPISGLALYESASISVIPEKLERLTRLVFSESATPQDVLRDVSLGADLLTIPFLGAASDAGMALDFTFPPAPMTTSHSPRPLAMDLWSPIYTTDTSPISRECECYTCRKHHRSYIRHLLTAKEMLAWTLLQIHNYHSVDLFFSNIRESIARGTFEQDVEAFEKAYESAFPEQTGQGPRYVILFAYTLSPLLFLILESSLIQSS